LEAVVATALAACFPDISKIIGYAMKNGLEDVLHKYEEHLIMGGFSLGYKAGQQSMLNNE
jgi:hypothetical protein